MLILLFIVTVIGSLISGLTGMAGGAVILGSLMFFFPAADALALHGLIQALSNGLRVVSWWKSIRFDVVGRYFLLLLPGAGLGGLLFSYLNLALVEAMLGALILSLVWVPTPKRFSRPFTVNGFIWLGLFSGFFSVFAGVVGPLLNPFFDKLSIKRESMVATKSACQLLLHLSRVTSYVTVVGLNFSNYQWDIAVMVVAVFAGIALTRPVGRHITDKQLDVLLKVLLTIMGVKNVVSGLVTYFQ
jgi:uncharacterized membrane protein YfcA